MPSAVDTFSAADNGLLSATSHFVGIIKIGQRLMMAAQRSERDDYEPANWGPDQILRVRRSPRSLLWSSQAKSSLVLLSLVGLGFI